MNTVKYIYITFCLSLLKEANILHKTLHQFSVKLHLHHADNPNGPIERSKRGKAVIEQSEEVDVVEEKKEDTPLPLPYVAAAEEEHR